MSFSELWACIAGVNRANLPPDKAGGPPPPPTLEQFRAATAGA